MALATFSVLRKRQTKKKVTDSTGVHLYDEGDLKYLPGVLRVRVLRRTPQQEQKRQLRHRSHGLSNLLSILL